MSRLSARCGRMCPPARLRPAPSSALSEPLAVTTLFVMRMPRALDGLHTWAGFRSSQARWAIKSLRGRARAHDGAFAHGEVSARAAQLTDLWERSWPEAEPLGYVLRAKYADRWVRFHSLPESKRHAESPAEYDEILRRHRIVLHELHGSENFESLHVIATATDWDWQGPTAGWLKRRLPSAWPWRDRPVDDDDPAAGRNYFWAASGLASKEIDALLTAAADDERAVIIGAPDLTWLYCPYDGGADVLLPSTAERDALRERHRDWLSAHPGGL